MPRPAAQSRHRTARQRTARPRLLLGAAVSLTGLALVGGAVLAATGKDAATSPRSRGFVAANYVWAAYDGDQATDCPDGLSLSAVDSFIALLPPAVRAKTVRPNDLGGQVRMVAGVKDPNDYRRAVSHNNCTNPKDYLAYTGFKTLNHKGVALGLDLDGQENSKDGQAAPGTCAHDSFQGPNGERGIDNQMWRAMGCTKGLRRNGDALAYAPSLIRQGGSNVLIEITGIDDERNDPEIVVGIYRGGDPVALDAAGEVLPGGSLHVHEDTRYHSLLKGRIQDGVVTTEPGEVTLKRDAPFEAPNDLTLKSARLKFELMSNGRAKGLLAGYYDVEKFYDAAIRVMTLAGAQSLGFPCPGLLDQMHRLADFDRDPETGKCRAISAAWEIDAVPAFIIHKKEQVAKTADAAAPAREENLVGGMLRRIGWRS